MTIGPPTPADARWYRRSGQLLAWVMTGLVLLASLAHQVPAAASAQAADPVSQAAPDAFERLRGDYRLADGRVVFVDRFSSRLIYLQDEDALWFLQPVTETTYAFQAGGELQFATDAAGDGATLVIRRPGTPDLVGQRVHFYAEEAVRFANGATLLAGSLLLPLQPGPHPAVVLIHGSGRTRRENVRNLAAAFARAGIAALIYDKRERYSATIGRRSYQELAGDALAAVRLLRDRPEVDPTRIGLWGISEGGWVAPLAAVQSADVAFVIAVSASGVIPLRQEVWLEENNLRQGGVGEVFVETVVQMWQAIADAQYLPLPAGVKQESYLLSDVHHDPVPVLERLQQPVLAIFGAEDTTVPPAESIAIMQTALARAGNPHVTLRVFPAADHGLLVSPDGDRSPTPGTVRYAPGYLTEMVAWVRQVTTGPPPGVGIVGELPVQARPTREVLAVPWFGRAAVQLGLLGFCLLTFATHTSLWLGAWLRARWRRPGRASTLPRPIRLLLGLVSSLGLLLLLGFLGVLSLVLLVAGEGVDQVGGVPLPWLILHGLAVLMLVLTAALVIQGVGAWRRDQVRGSERLRLALVSLAGLLMVPWLLYWNLVPL